MRMLWVIGVSAVLLPISVSAATVSLPELFSLTNEVRVQVGVPVLAENQLLDRAAQLKAEDMATRGYYSHITPEGYTPLHFLDQVGYAYQNAGENIAGSYNETAQGVHASLVGSPEHYANIISPNFTEMGLGEALGMYQGQSYLFVVEEFALPRAVEPVAPTIPSAPAPVTQTASPVSVTHTALDPVTATPKPVSATTTLEQIVRIAKTVVSQVTASSSVATSTPTPQSAVHATSTPVEATTTSPVFVQPTLTPPPVVRMIVSSVSTFVHTTAQWVLHLIMPFLPTLP